MTKEREASRRALAVLVGPESKMRIDLARGLIDRDTAVVLCSGPPGCALVREESCPLVNTADAIVILPTTAHDREVVTELSLCAMHARNAVVCEPSTVAPDVRAVRVRTGDAEQAASMVDSVLHHPGARRRTATTAGSGPRRY